MYRIALVFSLLISCNTALACPDIDGLLDVNCDGALEIVAFGDSITFGRADELELGYPGRLQLLLPNADIVNLGIPGEQTPTGKLRAAINFPTYASADYFIVLQGVNDYWLPNKNSFDTRDNLFLIKQLAEETGAITLLATLTDVRRSYQKGWVNSVNNRIRPATTLDFFAFGDGIISNDLLHPHGAGYQVMAEYVLAYLVALTSIERPVDTDGDLVYDYEEEIAGTNISLTDTDGDGLSDGEELYTHNSNPLLTDSDGDGVADNVEVLEGADPNSAIPGAPTLESLEVIS
jgi:lysophospholipase L1-like esterase